MFGKGECGNLGLTSIESFSEIEISHFVACKNYDEIITHTQSYIRMPSLV